MFRICFSILLLATFWSCNSDLQKDKNKRQTEKIFIEEDLAQTDSIANDPNKSADYKIVSDIDNDGNIDSVWVKPPTLLNDNCNGECETKVSFYGKFPDLKIPTSIGGKLSIVQDMDEDGIAELMFQPDWFSSCWSRIDFYTFKKDKWVLFEQKDYYRCMENPPTYTEKTDKGNYVVHTYGFRYDTTYSTTGDTGIESTFAPVTYPIKMP